MLGYALGGAIFVAAFYQANAQLDVVASAAASVTWWQWLAGFVLFTIHTLVNAIGFGSLHGRSVEVGIRPAIRRAWLATLPAKYVPGGVWHWLGRGALLSRLGVSASRTATIGLIEQAISVVSLVLACLFLVALRPSGIFWPMLLITLAVLAIVLLSVLARRRSSAGWREIPQQFLTGLPWYLFSMLPFALGYLVFVLPSAWLEFSASLFAGTLAGVLAVPVPGGLGVREYVTSYAFGTENDAAILALLGLARVATVASELALSAIAGLGSFREYSE